MYQDYFYIAETLVFICFILLGIMKESSSQDLLGEVGTGINSCSPMISVKKGLPFCCGN